MLWRPMRSCLHAVLEPGVLYICGAMHPCQGGAMASAMRLCDALVGQTLSKSISRQ